MICIAEIVLVAMNIIDALLLRIAFFSMKMLASLD